MRPGVGADRVALAGIFLHHLGVGDRHAPDQEKGGLGAVRRQRLQDRSGVGAQRPVIEGEDHLAVGEEAGVLVLKAEARAGARIDLEGAPDAKRLRTAGLRCGQHRCAGHQAQQQRQRARNAHFAQIPLRSARRDPTRRRLLTCARGLGKTSTGLARQMLQPSLLFCTNVWCRACVAAAPDCGIARAGPS